MGDLRKVGGGAHLVAHRLGHHAARHRLDRVRVRLRIRVEVRVRVRVKVMVRARARVGVGVGVRVNARPRLVVLLDRRTRPAPS